MTYSIAAQEFPGVPRDFNPSQDGARSNPLRVRIFNVKYSPNLGDGLLSECLEQALIDCGAHADTRSVDLAGRKAYGPGPAQRGALIRSLHMLPPPVRQLSVRLPLAIQSRRRWQPHYSAALLGAECVVIGGGNLIVDLDLNFPTKIALAIRTAEQCGLPAFIYGCGMSSGWSREGHARMRRALERGVLRGVFLRDERSRLLWNAEFGDAHGLPALVVPDPGLLASYRYESGMKALPDYTGRSVIGLNITSPVAVRYHSSQPVETGGLERWYCDLAQELAIAGHEVRLFTNGSPEDRACALRVRAALQSSAWSERFSHAQPETPAALATLIGGFQGLVAFRMHAVIASYSYRVPFVALQWDSKLESFVQSVARGDWLIDPFNTSPQAAGALLGRAMACGIEEEAHAAVMERARAGVAMLHAEIVQAVMKA